MGQNSNAQYGRNSNLNNNNIQNPLKNKFQNPGMQDGYFQGFYPGSKQHQSQLPQGPQHQGEAFFGKHEAEYHQKAMLQSQHQFGTFHNQKHDFQGHKQDFSHSTKGDFNHKAPPNEFHGKGHEFHQGQVFYNENMQYPPQYYHNEFEVAAAAADGNGNAGYYDPKTQQHYYDNMNYHHGGVQTEYPPEMYGPGGTMTNENCENFASFQQYYEHQQQQQQQHGHVQPPHQVHPHAHMPQNVPGAFVHNQQQQFPMANPSTNPNIAGNLENSNSSSDFNFLSNLANDFAPEYYQLS
jgi:homeobox protein HoxA/B2